MKKWLSKFIFLIAMSLSFYSSSSFANSSKMYPFNDVALEQRFQHLNQILRCLVCQNQNLADSHAPLAEDLRQRVYQQLQQGKSDQEIIEYLTSRYGDFILFKPPVIPSTWFLWFGPLLFFIGGLIVLIRNSISSAENNP